MRGTKAGSGRTPGKGMTPGIRRAPGRGRAPERGRAPGRGMTPGRGREPGRVRAPGRGGAPGGAFRPEASGSTATASMDTFRLGMDGAQQKNKELIPGNSSCGPFAVLKKEISHHTFDT